MSADFYRLGQMAAASPDTFNWQWFGRLLARKVAKAEAGQRHQRRPGRPSVVSLAEWRAFSLPPPTQPGAP